MAAYIIRRLLLIIPTLLGILVLNFFIIQSSPGGPVEQMIARLQGEETEVTDRFSGEDSDRTLDFSAEEESSGIYQGSKGLDPELIREIKRMYGFDKPIHQRFLIMLKRYLRFDFGDSFFRDKNVIELIKEKMPVSISLGLWSTLIVYLVSIPLGIRKAVKHGSRFDVWSSTVIIVGNAVPVFLFAILLIVLFAGGEYWEWFPLRGLTSDNFASLSIFGKIGDYFWHLTLPLLALLIGSFTSLTILTKNSFLDEINKHYVITARAKGANENRILYGHVFRNAMLIIVSGFPSAFIGMFFSGSLLIEVIFSLDGIGLLGFEAVMKRDYPVIFGTLFIFTLMGLIVSIISDVTYMLVDPRIDFEDRGR